ncbi:MULTISPECIES: hypothetical protein [unclassified Nonomuraea]|uniref:hypothetical protein n=1 Tax=unclassified Nonomuraea TaxID=2593643 RepID=UPI0033DE618C
MVRTGARPDSNGQAAHSGGEYQALRRSTWQVPSGAVSGELWTPSLSSTLRAENTP